MKNIPPIIEDSKSDYSNSKSLFENEEPFKFIVQNLSEGILITDLQGQIQYINQQLEDLTGYTLEHLKGQKVGQSLVAQPHNKIFQNNIKQIQQGISNTIILDFNHESGRKWLGKINAAPFKNSKQEIVGVLGVVGDISAQLMAELKLIESEQKLRKIIDASLDAIINIDQEGRVIEWSQQAEHIFGYKLEETRGQSMSDLIVPQQYREAHQRGMKHFLKTGEGPVLNKRIEITAINKEGKEFPIELSISPIKIDGHYFFSSFIRDITDRKRAEQELISAKHTAEQARLAERQFLANMSHEIRTPMNAVIGMTHLLYESNPTPAQKDYLDSLRFSADSLMGILNNILDLSKIEANELEFEQKRFNLTELLKSIQQTFQLKVREKPISVTLEVDSKIKNQVIGDAVRLNQILTNLLGNAGKFTQEGTIGIRTTLLASTEEQYILQFQIHDTGIGIDSENIHKIFENFKQADIGISRKFGGTGLGLTIVQQLVEMQGGTIQVDSTKGKGSVFTFVLPFKNAGIPQEESTVTTTPQQNTFKSIEKINLLVVEDNPMNQKLILKILELWNCPHDLAPSGRDALQKTQNKKYDVILMDVHMPEMDGCETTTKIRANTNNPNAQTPIIALTAAALLDEKNRALQSGMNDFLTKPFSPNQLKESIFKQLNFSKEKTTSPVETSLPLDVNFSYLKKMSKGDEDFIRDMIQIFLREIPSAIQQFEKAFQSDNWNELADIAHRIKTNYMMVGMNTQEATALFIEKSIKENNFDPELIYHRFSQLKQESEKAYPLLKKRLEQ